MRRFADPICVLTGPDDQPRVFRWRGRRYEVTEVLAQWLEVTPWWRVAAQHPAVDLPAVHDRQRQVWRVEAGGGVFDLAAAGSTGASPTGASPTGASSTGASPTRWLLLAALD
jgi:hypothetical protein